MKAGATLWERFEGWFCMPIDKLKECPDGNGAFLAMSAALFLCERFYRTKTNTHEGLGDDLAFRQAAASDFGIDPKDFEVFWQVFRHGIQHQGMPKRYSDKAGVVYSGRISGSFTALPLFVSLGPKQKEIQIDPWKFAGLIIEKYRRNPSILADAMSHAFWEVQ